MFSPPLTTIDHAYVSPYQLLFPVGYQSSCMEGMGNFQVPSMGISWKYMPYSQQGFTVP